MSDLLSLDAGHLSAPELQSYLQGAVAPRPIALASTIDNAGNINLSPFSFFNLFSIHPPILIFSVTRRIRDNSIKHTLENILEVPEVCISTVSFAMGERMSYASNEFAREINEFKAAGFEAAPSVVIKPPRVAESPVSFECTVDRVIPLGDEGGAGNLVIARVHYLHIRKEVLDEKGKISSEKAGLIARLGGHQYSRLIPEAIFEMQKPG